ncbi:MAG: FHA domain-containing protein [Cyanobacteria bacterium P01_H01_bin.15]
MTQPLTNIGRHTSNDIVLSTNRVSRYHASLLRTRTGGDDEKRFQLIDGGAARKPSSNGTYVNGERITDCFLNSQDLIQLGTGGEQLVFLTVQPEQLQELLDSGIDSGQEKQALNYKIGKNSTLIHTPIAAPQLTTENLARLGVPKRFIDYVKK